MDKAIKIRKGIEIQPIYLGVETRADACGKPPTEKGVIRKRKKVYMPPLPSTYKETELLDDLNDGMEWVFRDYEISLKQAKDPLQPRYDVMEFDVLNNTKELEKN